MQTTCPTTKLHYPALAVVLSLLLNSGLAQTATPAAPEPARAASDDEEIILSPFVVDASQDVGYRASSTLAGSRIKTDLRDVSQSITVITKDFMQDIGAVNVNDIMAYTAGAEGTRDYTATTSSLSRPTDGAAVSSGTNGSTNGQRIRGLASPNITRDYFTTIGTYTSFDEYNLDEVTVVRGPNSILAGLGSPAGIINYSPQMARLSKDRTEVTYRVGSYGDQRASFNSNFVVKKDVFAFRLAGVWAQQEYQQKPAWNKDKRLYGTFTYKPWTKTTIRLSYETVKVNSDTPNNLTLEDGVSQWVANGRPTYDSSSTAPVSNLLTLNATNMPTIIYNRYGTIEGAYNNNALGYTYFQGNQNNVGLWSAIRMNSDKYIDAMTVNTSPSINDMRMKAFNISIDQEIAKGLYGNFSYVNEKVDNDFLNLFRTEYAIYNIDVNKKLPGGADNPHFLETYMIFRGLDNKVTDHNENRVMRGTLNYDLNLTKQNKWLGRYKLTGFMEHGVTETDRLTYNAKQVGDNAESVGYLYYLGGTETTKPTAVPLHPTLVTGVTGSFLDAASGTYKTGIVDTYYGLKSDVKNKTQLDTKAIVLQGYFWGDRIVPMVGVRRDTNKAAFLTSSGMSGGNANLAGSDLVFGDPVAKTTNTYGVVVHPLKWLSLHYNQSENFIPNAGSIDLLGNTTPSPTGETKEYGFSVSLLENKLNAKLNWFELTSANASATNANFPLAQWTIPFMDLTFMPDLARQAGIQYQKLVADGIITGDSRLANAYTSDNVSKGIELELTYNVTKNWRVMGSVSKQDAKQANIASGLTAFIQNRLAYWQSIPALWTGYTAQNVGWGVGRTGQQQWNNDNLPSYLNYTSAEGQPSTQLAKWHANIVSNYQFSDGFLKGFSFGMGARYIEKAVIGNPVITNAAGAIIGLDLAHPYYSETIIPIDAWIGYRTKIYADKYDLSVNFRVRDLQESGGYRPITANSDGTPSAFRIVQPRSFYLSTTIGF